MNKVIVSIFVMIGVKIGIYVYYYFEFFLVCLRICFGNKWWIICGLRLCVGFNVGLVGLFKEVIRVIIKKLIFKWVIVSELVMYGEIFVVVVVWL